MALAAIACGIWELIFLAISTGEHDYVLYSIAQLIGQTPELWPFPQLFLTSQIGGFIGKALTDLSRRGRTAENQAIVAIGSIMWMSEVDYHEQFAK